MCKSKMLCARGFTYVLILSTNYFRKVICLSLEYVF